MNDRSSRFRTRTSPAKQPAKRRGPKPRQIVEFPESLTEWSDPSDFGEALASHTSRHGDTIWHLHRAVTRAGETFDRTSIREWCAGRKAPRSVTSLRVLQRIERRYRLPEWYFRTKLAHPGRATTGQAGSLNLTPSERRRIAWHLPDDFDRRPLKQREEIVDWVRLVIISECTDSPARQ